MMDADSLTAPRGIEDVENFVDAILSVIDGERLDVNTSIDDILSLLSDMGS